MTDDVDWATEAAGDVAPWYGQRVGKEQVAAFFQAIGAAVEAPSPSTSREPLSQAALALLHDGRQPDEQRSELL